MYSFDKKIHSTFFSAPSLSTSKISATRMSADDVVVDNVARTDTATTDDDEELERHARIMELAQQQQQQQMAMQNNLDGDVVVENSNQRQTTVLQAQYYYTRPINRGQARVGGGSMMAPPALNNLQQHQPDQRNNGLNEDNDIMREQPGTQPHHVRHRAAAAAAANANGGRRQGGRGGASVASTNSYSCSFASVYFTMSTLIAILALATTPTNVLFAYPSSFWVRGGSSSSRSSVSSLSFTRALNGLGDVQQQLHQIVDEIKAAHKHEDETADTVAVSKNDDKSNKDSHEKLDDTAKKRFTPTWDVGSKINELSSLLTTAESSTINTDTTKSSESTKQYNVLPSSLISARWVEHYILLQEVNFRTALAHLLLSDIPSTTDMTVTSTSAAAAATPTSLDNKSSVSSSTTQKRIFPWEWLKQQQRPTNDYTSVVSNSQEQKTMQGSDDASSLTSKQHRMVMNNNGGNVTFRSILLPIWNAINPSTSKESATVIKYDKEDTVIINNSTDSSSSPQATKSLVVSIVDKIFTSTPRLIAIANLILVLTYLLLFAMAELFLGHANGSSSNMGRTDTYIGLPPPQLPVAAPNQRHMFPHESNRRRRAGRERFVGSLLFKLTLIAVVLEPDRIDLFILFVWYTIVSLLKCLSHLAGSTAAHASQSGEPPRLGVLRLLCLVLVCNMVAAMGCATIVRTDWNMLILLTFDCILLGMEVICHLLKHVVSTSEEVHRMKISTLEERQLELHAHRQVQVEGSNDSIEDHLDDSQESGLQVDDELSFENELRRIDEEIQNSESVHGRHMALIGSVIFSSELVALFMTIAHFFHIWSMHGNATLSAIDGILVLHLHSTISVIGKKIVERRNIHRVTREINSSFPDASDKDIRKASAVGDVCCICLNSLLVGGVKKLRCSHLFHTNCLREVIERERTFASAKCPLCRASVITGKHETNRPDSRVVHPVAAAVDGGEEVPAAAQPINQQQMNVGEQSLIRFSTENFLPRWLPIPAFAFEVVRREAAVVIEQPNPNPEAGWQRFFRRGGQMQGTVNNNVDGNDQVLPQDTPSSWRRFLILMGAVPMSPEEEAIALEQLVDMFPQFYLGSSEREDQQKLLQRRFF